MPPTDKHLGGFSTGPRPEPHHVESLSTDLPRLLDELEALRRDVERADTRRRKENSYIIAVAACLILPIILILAVAWQNLGIARDARASAAEARRTADRIEDCTTPTGKCYRDGSKRTGGAVANLARIQIVVASCQRLTITEPALTACIVSRLRGIGVTLPPTP